MKSNASSLILGAVVFCTVAICCGTLCQPAIADDDVLLPVPKVDLNFGGRSTQGMIPDDGTDVLHPTATPDLNFGGRSTQGMKPDDGTDVLHPTATPDLNFGGRSAPGIAQPVSNTGDQPCLPKTRLTGSLVAASEILSGSPCQPPP